MGLEKYFYKEFEIDDFCFVRIYESFVSIYVEGAALDLQHIKTEDQLLQLLSLLTGKDQNEFKV